MIIIFYYKSTSSLKPADCPTTERTFSKKNMEGVIMEKKQKSKFYKVVLCLLLLSLSLIISCKSVPPPQLPPDPAKLNQEEKGKAYNDYELTKKGSVFWGTYFLQGANQQKYTYDKVEMLFDASSEAAISSYKKGTSLTFAGLIAAGTGGALLGYPFGGYLVTGEFMTSDYIMLGTGAGLIIVSWIVSEAADKSFEKGVNEYNSYLKNQY